MIGERRWKGLQSGNYEMPDGPIVVINMQEDESMDLHGAHVHMCPECFEDVQCDDWCTWDGESTTNEGVPTCHPVICDRCREIMEQYQSQGSGI